MTVSYNEDRGKLEIELFGELGHVEALEAIDNISALYECIMLFISTSFRLQIT